ncbi:MAG: hypothetical protein AAF761_06870, partial [Pseudomonadota bacterium]
TRVHDWFLAHDAIDEVRLTIEPISFGGGLAMFAGSAGDTPEQCIERTGLTLMADTKLNSRGTRHLIWQRST